jgi:hypothetical protein
VSSRPMESEMKTILILILSMSAWAQKPSATVTIQDNIECPYKVNLEEYIDANMNANLLALKAELEASRSGDENCPIIDDITYLITSLTTPGATTAPGPISSPTASPTDKKDLPEDAPDAMMNGGKKPDKSNGNSGDLKKEETPSSPAPTPDESQLTATDDRRVACVQNPMDCIKTIQTIVATLKDSDNVCANNKDNIIKNLVSVIATVGTATGNPLLATGAIGAGLLVDIIKLFKKNKGAVAQANKLDKQKIEALEQNLSGLGACMANQVYLSTVCSRTFFHEIKITARTKEQTKVSKASANLTTMHKLSNYYYCYYIQNKYADKLKSRRQELCATEAGFESYLEMFEYKDVFNKQSFTRDFVEENSLETLIKMAKSYNKGILTDLSKDFKKTVKETRSKFNKSKALENQDKINKLLQVCQYGFISNSVTVKEAVSFTHPWKGKGSKECQELNKCVERVNKTMGTDYLTVKDFLDKGILDSPKACEGLLKVSKQTDDKWEKLSFYLVESGFDANGVCQTSRLETYKKEDTTSPEGAVKK